jgi:hypothetical protein
MLYAVDIGELKSAFGSNDQALFARTRANFLTPWYLAFQMAISIDARLSRSARRINSLHTQTLAASVACSRLSAPSE